MSLPRCSRRLGRWTLVFLRGSPKPLGMWNFAWEGTGNTVGLRFENHERVAGAAGGILRMRKRMHTGALPAYGFEFGWLLPRDQFAVPGFDASNVVDASGRNRLENRRRSSNHVSPIRGWEWSSLRTLRSIARCSKFFKLADGESRHAAGVAGEPEGLETDSAAASLVASTGGETEDMPPALFRSQVTPTCSLAELRKQRGLAASTRASA